MKLSFSLFTLIIAFGILEAQEQSDLNSLKLEFDIERAELRKPIQELQTKYDESLNQLLQKVTGAGELEKALAVRAEIEGYKDGKSKPVVEFPELRRLQDTYASILTQRATAMNQELSSVVEVYSAKLEALQKTLTKENRLDEALAVKQAINEIEKTLISKPLTKEIDRNAIVYTDAVFSPFRKDVVAFTNKKYKWIVVPLRFADYEFSMGIGGVNEILKFSVTKGGTVTILAETADVEVLSRDGWKAVAQAEREWQRSARTSILERELPPGDYSIVSLDFLGVRLLRPANEAAQTTASPSSGL